MGKKEMLEKVSICFFQNIYCMRATDYFYYIDVLEECGFYKEYRIIIDQFPQDQTLDILVLKN